MSRKLEKSDRPGPFYTRSDEDPFSPPVVRYQWSDLRRFWPMEGEMTLEDSWSVRFIINLHDHKMSAAKIAKQVGLEMELV